MWRDYKLITNKPDAPWTLAQSWKPYDTAQMIKWAEQALERGETIKLFHNGEPVTLEDMRARL